MRHYGSPKPRALALFLGLAVHFSSLIALGAEQEPEVPEKYILDYPVADAFCPPIRSTFFEVTQTMGVVRGHRFRQKLNGGYGLPVVDKVGDKHLLHLGADLGWHQVGEPVFAVAAGVVRISSGPVSSGPPPKPEKGTAPKPEKSPPPKPEKDAAKQERGPLLAWGNLIVIEHRTESEGEFFTTVYGHLGADRKVKVGDVVEVGTQIGEIGRQSPFINGGYKPHLHFGVREGRFAEEGMTLFQLATATGRSPVRLARLGEEEIELAIPEAIMPETTTPEATTPRIIKLTLQGEEFSLAPKGGKFFLPAKILWRTHRADFPIVGYGLSTAGWCDPIAFLRERDADTRPPPFKLAKPARPPKGR
jgi:murein DD-endopeptidase MepM/ murein hydrolase activator NlpD